MLDRVERFEPHIHATYLLAPERALRRPAPPKRAGRRGEPIGPLDGVPATIKDNIATKGDPSPIGTAASDLTPAAADAPPAARLREAGAIMFAKTTMPDYGMLSSASRASTRSTRNPWKLDRNPGGSSAGAGAAGAALAMARCIWAPTSAARCGCLPAGAASSGSSPAPAAFQSIRLMSAGSPAR